ncbi:sensor histidine kinase [Streptomyces profundus]|uniref:sensor histidine kinase n=1 Tax=Streptomyces profundus TaxID=2867410 RepID=UPI001D1656DF|nr:histidine kinase [Streptomyces sp. MA3_2.13]UED85129.1 hypothetical protein K4G22_13745 [Streptomyces sp. MA3_2.13]
MQRRTWAEGAWQRLLAKGVGAWSGRRTAGEVVLAAINALVAGVGLTRYGVAAMVVGAVVAAVLSLLRRFVPGGVLVVAGALTGAFGVFWLMLVLAGWSAGRRIVEPRRVVGAFAASCGLHSALTAVGEPRMALEPRALLFVVLAYLTTTVLPGVVNRYRGQRRTLLRALHEHNAQLLRERELIAAHARLRERQRIAQDMHDSLGHQLALISLRTGALEVDPSLTVGQREKVVVLREASATALRELRDAVGVLHEGEPDGGASEGRGTGGIEELVAAARQAGAEVALRRAGEERPLAPAGEQAAYRVAQEALTNALKHAPGAPVTVELRYEPDALVVEIANGPLVEGASGADVVSGGQGLTGIGERARLVGGMVHAGPTADGGFRIAGLLPYGPPNRPAPDAGAPFVEAVDDFRRQRPAGAVGDGGAVIDWAGSPHRQGEFDRAMGQGLRRGRRACAIGCGALLLGVVGIGVLAYWGIREATKTMIDPEVYEAARIGENEAALRERLPDSSFMLTDLEDDGPPKPAGADCLVLLSSDQPEDSDEAFVFRFCFKDGELVEKRSYAVGW